MDQESNLVWLAKLRDSGMISEQEFQRRQAAILKEKPPSQWSWLWELPFMLSSVLGIIYAIIRYTGTDSIKSFFDSRPVVSNARPTLPACDSDDVKDSIQKIIQNTVNLSVKNYDLVDWNDIHLLNKDGTMSMECSAHLFLTSGEKKVIYKIFFPTSKSEQWLIQMSDAVEGDDSNSSQ